MHGYYEITKTSGAKIKVFKTLGVPYVLHFKE